MIEPTKKRRRWPWVLGTELLLLVGGPLAWRYRPLTAAERNIVGLWQVDPRSTNIRLTTNLNADRSFSRQYVSDGTPWHGSWHIDGEDVVLTEPRTPWKLLGDICLQRRPPPSALERWTIVDGDPSRMQADFWLWVRVAN